MLCKALVKLGGEKDKEAWGVRMKELVLVCQKRFGNDFGGKSKGNELIL